MGCGVPAVRASCPEATEWLQRCGASPRDFLCLCEQQCCHHPSQGPKAPRCQVCPGVSERQGLLRDLAGGREQAGGRVLRGSEYQSWGPEKGLLGRLTEESWHVACESSSVGVGLLRRPLGGLALSLWQVEAPSHPLAYFQLHGSATPAHLNRLWARRAIGRFFQTAQSPSQHSALIARGEGESWRGFATWPNLHAHVPRGQPL